jgi:hypothetical protein
LTTRYRRNVIVAATTPLLMIKLVAEY